MLFPPSRALTLLALSSFTLTLAFPVSPLTDGQGLAPLTGPVIDNVVGAENVKSIDAAADVLGVAQYGAPDNGEDENALPQQTLGNLIGEEGVITDAVQSGGKSVFAKRGSLITVDRLVNGGILGGGGAGGDGGSLRDVGKSSLSGGLLRKRVSLADGLAAELTEINHDVDLLVGYQDQIANNLLGVCGENTSAENAPCDSVNAGQT